MNQHGASHTLTVLRDLGFNERELAALQASGTIAAAADDGGE
jgi:hypothetical protein